MATLSIHARSPLKLCEGSSRVHSPRAPSRRFRVVRSERGENENGNQKVFVYSRAKPEVRWPERSGELQQQRLSRIAGAPASRVMPPDCWEELSRGEERVREPKEEAMGEGRRMPREREREVSRQQQKGQVRRLQSMSKLALRKATDVHNKALRLATAIWKSERAVSEVLEEWSEVLNNDEMSSVVRSVGERDWRRALELYEWLDGQKWYTSNPRLLATVLSVLGRASQLEAARELFLKADPELTSSIQVFNAILGVYAKQGQWQAAEHILELIALRGCEPDIITFNMIANARCKAGLQPGMASALLREIENTGLRPDIVSYNTLLGACIAMKYFTEASEIVKEMGQRGFDLEACTSYVSGKSLLNVDEGERPVLSETPSNDDLEDDASTEETSSEMEKPLNISGVEVSTPHFVAGRGTVERSQLVLKREHVLGEDFCYKSQLKLCTSTTGGPEGALKELWRQAEYLFGLGMVRKVCESSFNERPLNARMMGAGINTLFSVQEMDHIVLKERSLFRTSSHHSLQFRLLGSFLRIPLKDALGMSFLNLNNITLKTTFPLVEGSMRKYFTNRIQFSGLLAGDPHQMIACSSDAARRPEDESGFSAICLFMQWKTVYVNSSAVQYIQTSRCGPRLGGRKFRPCQMHTSGWNLGGGYHTITTNLYKRWHLYKRAQAADTERASYMLSDSEVAQVEIQGVEAERVEPMNASSYNRLINECMMKKDYVSGAEQLAIMVNAGMEPGYMTWISVLQACVQCVNRVDLLRLLAALRDAGCPLPLRLIMERDAALPEMENWLRNLQATAADAGQGMVNVLLDILWAFKLRSTAGHFYDLAVHLDMYPRNFAKVEELNWEADFRNLSPGAALVAMNHWFIEMQRASLDGFPEPPKEVLMVTGTQGYQNSVSLNKTIRAHLWEMGSPFYMRLPREGALISKGHALRLWLKDSPRCFNLELEDSAIIPKTNSMRFFKGAWMSTHAVPVMTQIHTSIGEVWPRRYSKLAQMSETKRTDALAARIENDQRRRLEKRDPAPKKKKQQQQRPPRRKAD